QGVARERLIGGRCLLTAGGARYGSRWRFRTAGIAIPDICSSLERMLSPAPAERIRIVIQRCAVALLETIRHTHVVVGGHRSDGRWRVCNRKTLSSLKQQRLRNFSLAGIGDFPWSPDHVLVRAISETRFVQLIAEDRRCKVDSENPRAPDH